MKISVVIPTYNESEGITQLITYLRQNSSDGNVKEIIIVDGFSVDETVSLARKAGARVLMAPEKGRAFQLNYGARQATGDVLYFLHADSFPPANFDKEIIRRITASCGAGSFRMKFDSTNMMLRFFAWFTRFNNAQCSGGDQSLFIHRDLFFSMGQYCEWPIMEDIDIIRRVRKRTSFRVIPKNVVTSARRYKDNGHLRLQFWFFLIYVQYWLGLSPHYIYRFYKRHVT